MYWKGGSQEARERCALDNRSIAQTVGCFGVVFAEERKTVNHKCIEFGPFGLLFKNLEENPLIAICNTCVFATLFKTVSADLLDGIADCWRN